MRECEHEHAFAQVFTTTTTTTFNIRRRQPRLDQESPKESQLPSEGLSVAKFTHQFNRCKLEWLSEALDAKVKQILGNIASPSSITGANPAS